MKDSVVIQNEPDESDEDGGYYRFTIAEESECGRLDKILSSLCSDLSRSRIQALVESGNVLVNNEVAQSSSKKLHIGDIVELSVPKPAEAHPVSENIPLKIIYEDDSLLVIDKPAGLVVHPGAGNREGTLVNALLHHCGASLSGIGGVLRPGIVHRLDKETSGLMVIAKNDRAHRGLSEQLADRSLSRIYKALVFKVPFPAKGHIDKPLARHPSNRLKMAVRSGGKKAKTFYEVETAFGQACALVKCRLESGRTHQIRVHMESLGHPLMGDPLYGPQKNAVAATLGKSGYSKEASDQVLLFPRQALHAEQLKFIHPVLETIMEFKAPLPEDINNLLNLLTK